MTMSNELTNLLPFERQRSLSRDYILRIVVVITWLLAIITFVAAALLLPTYVLLSANSDTKEARLAHIKSTISSADEAAFAMRLTKLSNNVAILTALSNAPSASTIVRTVLAVARPGIILSGLDYTPAALKSSDTLILSGTSATRAALRNYQLALESVPLVRSATLPISAYAKETDITFTITLTLAP